MMYIKSVWIDIFSLIIDYLHVKPSKKDIITGYYDTMTTEKDTGTVDLPCKQ